MHDRSDFGAGLTLRVHETQAGAQLVHAAQGGGWRADRPPRPGYSPITDQRKPIMMKKPVNMAISPMPPYGEFAPMWGTS